MQTAARVPGIRRWRHAARSGCPTSPACPATSDGDRRTPVLRLVREQLQQQRRRLGVRHAVDADRIAHADEQRGASGLRMDAHDRVRLRCSARCRVADRHRAALVALAVHALARIGASRRVHALACPSAADFIAAGSASHAAYWLANSVSPPTGGMTSPYSTRRRRRARQKAPVGVPVLGEDRRLLVGLALHLRDVRMAGDRVEVRIDAERPDRPARSARGLQLQSADRETPAPGAAATPRAPRPPGLGSAARSDRCRARARRTAAAAR